MGLRVTLGYHGSRFRGLLAAVEPRAPRDAFGLPGLAQNANLRDQPAPISTLVKSEPVNWLPWSVLKISGLPCRASASSSAATQNDASIVFDNRQERIARLAQSMTATT